MSAWLSFHNINIADNNEAYCRLRLFMISKCQISSIHLPKSISSLSYSSFSDAEKNHSHNKSGLAEIEHQSSISPGLSLLTSFDSSRNPKLGYFEKKFHWVNIPGQKRYFEKSVAKTFDHLIFILQGDYLRIEIFERRYWYQR